MAELIIELDGKTYKGMQAFADAFNLKVGTVKYRRKHGWSWERIAATPVCGMSTKNEVIKLNGGTYVGYRVFADAFGLSVNTVRARRRLGWTWKEIASSSVGSWRTTSDPSIEVDFRGKHYLSLTALADDYNIPRGTIYAKLTKGQSLEEIVTASERRTYEYNGVMYKSVASLARAVGMERATLDARLKSCASVEEALSKPYLRSRAFVCNDKHYTSKAALCRELGVDTSVLNRLLLNNTLQEAVDIIVNNWRYCATSIRSLPDVATAKSICGGKFVLITCKVCSRKVVLPLEEVKKFAHSVDCERNEWLEV